MRKVFLLLLAIMAWSASWAADQTLDLKGSGTKADPYQVTSAADLQAIAAACNTTAARDASHFVGKYFKQMANIDMSGVTDFIGIGTAPFGTYTSTTFYFGGTYDGNGYTISNMKIDAMLYNESTGKPNSSSRDGSRKYVGLFGTIGYGAVIKNVTLDASCSIEGYQYVGGIVGEMYNTKSSLVQNCKSAATVKAYYSYAGGIAGYAKSPTSGGYKAIIENCLNTGKVYSGREYAGGIAGYMYAGSIIGCQNEGSVSCEELNPVYTSGFKGAGGIVGSLQNKASMTNCVNLGKVNASSTRAGGIAGDMSSSADTLVNCANFGEVECPDATTTGSIAGYAAYAPILTNGIYDSQIAPKPIAGGDADGATGLLTSQLTSGTVAGLDASVWTVKAGFYPYLTAHKTANTETLASLYFTLPSDETATDFKTSATLPAGVTATLKNGTAFTVADGKITASSVQAITEDVVTLAKDGLTKDVDLQILPKLWNGTGTAQDPYLIENAQDLVDMATMTDRNQLNHYEGVYFKQTADIDASSLTDFAGIAVADSINKPETIVWFAGNYDGQGHSVTLNINDVAFSSTGAALGNTYAGSYANVGLFGTLAEGAVVKNLTIKGSIKGYSYVGSVAGQINTGAVVENIINEAEVKGYYNYVGGIVGYAKDTTVVITSCRNKGAVICGYSDVGGIAGSNYGLISQCQNDGPVSAIYFEGASGREGVQSDAGGIVGYNYSRIINCLNTGSIYALKNKAGGIAASNSYLEKYNGKLEGCVNLGNVKATTTPTSVGAIIGYQSSASVPSEAVYFDGQISGMPAISNAEAESGVVAANTSMLTSGKVEGLDASVWTVKAGFYPVLKQYDDAWSEDVASTYVTLPEGETSTNFKTSGTISKAQDDITAELQDGSLFNLADGVLTAGISKSIAVDTLILKNGNFTLWVPLQKLPKVWSGAGTEADPYLIKTADDFLAASSLLSEANYSYEGEYFKVVADLDFSGKELAPLGDAVTAFAGTFDGQGHTFKNITYEATGEDGDPHTGIDVALFGYTAPGSLVKNIKLADSKISGFKNIAGIVAQSKGPVTGCEVAATVELTDTVASKRTTTLNNLGGIVALDNSTSEVIYRDNVNRAKLNGFLGIGGIVGFSKNDDAKIINCQNYGEISSDAIKYTYNVGSSSSTRWPEIDGGGIAGSFTGCIDSCANYGSMSQVVGQVMGGIVGKYGHTTTNNTITNCENHGAITAGYAKAGGIVGAMNSAATGSLTVANCYNDAPITVNYNNYGAGIVAYGNVNTKISYCYNTADVKLLGVHDDNYSTSLASGNGGGILGATNGKGVVVDHCWNSGYVKGPGYMGGIVGQGGVNNDDVSNCFNVGTVEIDSTSEFGYVAVGGIAAQGRVNVSNSYNVGQIIGSKYVAGIVGYNTGGSGSSAGTDAKSVYNTGAIKLYAFDDNEKYVGHIYGAGNVTTTTLAAALYLEDGQKLYADSVYALTGSTSQELTGAAPDTLGDGFVYNDYAFPLIKGLENVDAAKAYASYFGLAEGETLDAINTRLPLSALEGVTWTATGGIKVQNGKAVPTALGAATLTATCGNFSKTYNLTITGIPALEGDINGDGLVNVEDVTELVATITDGKTDSKYDLNGDGLINVEDVTYLVNLVLQGQ